MKMELAINAENLIVAMSYGPDMIGNSSWYLDTETGDLLLDSDEVDDVPEDIDDNPRYLWIEPIHSHTAYQIMEDFVANLTDVYSAQVLSRALSERKPFRRFKDALLDFPLVRESWFAFEHDVHMRLAEEWCEANEIIPTWRTATNQSTPEPHER